MNPVQMFKLFGEYHKFQTIEKENISMNLKVTQYVSLLVSVAGTLGLPTLATNWVHAHLTVYMALVAAAIVLHAIFPSIFSAPSQADRQASGLAGTTSVLLMFLMLSVCSHAQTAAPAMVPGPIGNLYAAGVSYNGSASASVAGTGLYAHQVGTSGTYAFTAVDVIPASYTPFTVTSNVGVGVAQQVATIGKIPIFVPTAVGISWTGSNTGWQWSGGAAVAIPLKNSMYIVPMVRFLKSSVSGGSGYQPVLGVLFGWGN